MTWAPLLLLTVVHTSSIEVWASGDDGQTQTFADQLRAAAASVSPEVGVAPLRATMAQAQPARSETVVFAVSFSRDGKEVGVSRCVATERDPSPCVSRAMAVALRLLRGAQ